VSEQPTPTDDDLDDEDVVLDDPEQEAFLRRLDDVRAAFLRGLLIAFPLWLLFLLLMSVVFRGASLPGFLIATLGAAGAFYALERRRGAGRPRITRNGAIALAIVGVFALMWVMFVFAASR